MFNLLSGSSNYTEIMNNIQNSPEFIAFSEIGSFVFWLIGHVFLSLAIYTMTKKQGFKKLWVSFIPFYNLIPLGKLVGKTTVWGVKLKNVGVWACIMGIVSTVVTFIIDLGYYKDLVEFVFPVKIQITSEFLISWTEQTSLEWLIAYYVSFVIDLAYIFFHVSLVFMVFRLYNPNRALIYAIISVFIDPAFGICLFISRNNPRYIIVRPQPPQGGYYGGYYGGGYYGGGYNNQQPYQNQKPIENPFPEFEDEDAKKDNSSNSSDDFFN